MEICNITGILYLIAAVIIPLNFAYELLPYAHLQDFTKAYAPRYLDVFFDLSDLATNTYKCHQIFKTMQNASNLPTRIVTPKLNATSFKKNEKHDFTTIVIALSENDRAFQHVKTVNINVKL